MRILSDSDVASVLDLEALLPVVAEAFRKQGRGEVERPDRPHFPVGTGLVPPGGEDDRPSDEPLGTGLVMPAYLHGAPQYATKLVGVHEGNSALDLPTVNATIALTNAATGQPAAYLAGSRITNARTGCIGGLAARELAPAGPVTVGVVGAGQQARWQVRAIATAIEVESVRIYSPSDSRDECAADLREHGIDATAVASAEVAVRDASVVVTATTATSPVFAGADLRQGALVVAVGAYTPEMQELDERTIDRAGRLYADVPAEAAETGDLSTVDPQRIVPFSTVLSVDAGDANDPDGDLTVVKSVGTAVLDAAAAVHVLEKAADRSVGRTVEL